MGAHHAYNTTEIQTFSMVVGYRVFPKNKILMVSKLMNSDTFTCK